MRPLTDFLEVWLEWCEDKLKTDSESLYISFTGSSAQNATETLPEAVNSTDDYCAYTCPFNSEDDDDDMTFTVVSIQPCIYTLEIIEVFKSVENYTVRLYSNKL